MIGSTAIDRAIVDTNVFVYAADPTDVKKRTQATEVIQALTQANQLVITAQILNEIYSVLTRPNRSYTVTQQEAAQVVQDLADASEVLPVAKSTTILALRGVIQHSLSFWDALIWAAAVEHGVRTIYSEDFQHGREVERVRFINPFI